MENRKLDYPILPEAYYFFDDDEAAHFHRELQRELPPEHRLFGVMVETLAAREGTDDLLFRHLEEPERFTVIYPTWLGKTEINAQHPTVDEGTFT